MDVDFLDMMPKVKFVKEEIKKLNLIKVENFCSVSDTNERMKRHATDKEKSLAILKNHERVSIQNV